MHTNLKCGTNKIAPAGVHNHMMMGEKEERKRDKTAQEYRGFCFALLLPILVNTWKRFEKCNF